MDILISLGIFVGALVALVKGADWVLHSSQKIGLALGMPPFLVGVLIVGFGTSAPELVSSVAGMLKGVTEIPAANAIGSNIANILLVVGVAALFSKKTLTITKNLIDLEIPLLVIVTLYFFGVAYDGIITRPESFFLLIGFVSYLAYSFFHSDDVAKEEGMQRSKLAFTDGVLLPFGFVLLIGGAKYMIDAVIMLSASAGISVGVITVFAVALGTSLPELIVSIRAARTGHGELAIGNIFGSNIFNLLLVVGASGVVGTQYLDVPTVAIALPVLLGTTLLFVISGISNKIHKWEGWFYLLVYILFIVKLFGWV